MSGENQFPEFLRSLPEVALPFADSRGWLFQGEGKQAVFIEFENESEVPAHSHAEQYEIVLAGSVVLSAENRSRHYERGDTFFIPAGVEHSARVSSGYRAIVVFNSPDRYHAKE